MLRFLSRQQIDDAEWDRCVDEAHNALFYGHSWYLDAVTNVPRAGRSNVPEWSWEGLVQFSADGTGYVAVLPVPLRRRWGRWVVYQPLFCQFLAVFSAHSVEISPFLVALAGRYRYAARLCLYLPAPLPNVPESVRQQVRYTHTMLVEKAPDHYNADRRMNLRRARRRVDQIASWQVRDATDIQPLLSLFRHNHADQIGVGGWAYEVFGQVHRALQERGLGTLRYAYLDNVPVAGALFGEQHSRIVYLFNAADPRGRHLNARTLLIDGQLQHAATRPDGTGLLFDFESPDKPGVVQFYESFGATPTPYVQLSWNRLTIVEKWLQRIKNRLWRG